MLDISPLRSAPCAQTPSHLKVVPRALSARNAAGPVDPRRLDDGMGLMLVNHDDCDGMMMMMMVMMMMIQI